jgi:hypothetical protein
MSLPARLGRELQQRPVAALAAGVLLGAAVSALLATQRRRRR